MATYTFDLVGRSGAVHHHTYTDDDGLRPGSVIRVEGRDLLVQRIEPDGGGGRLIVARFPAAGETRYQPGWLGE